MMRAIRVGVLPLALVVACAGRSAGVGDVESGEGVPEPSAPPTAPGVPITDGFQLVTPVDDEQPTPPERVDLPDGTHTLGYTPSPVSIPQPPLFLTTDSLPTSYDLRARNKLPAVRDQRACGSCWAFASLASSESNILPGETWDFSEEHLNLTHAFDVAPCNGGNSSMAIAYLSRWSGPVAEADAPYTGTVHSFASVPTPRKHLTEALFLPNRTGPLDNGALKTAVTSFGAVYTTMSWSNAAWRGPSSFYNAGPYTRPNHAVSIVGFRDDFPATSFAQRPAGDGAFLVRNSWGTSFGDAGYFWVSYHDAFIGRENVVFRRFASTATYDDVYQYDRYGQTTALTLASNTSYIATVHTARAATSLEAVALYTTAPNATVTVSVHDAPITTPTSGTLLGRHESTQAYAGYHTIALDSLGVRLQSGRKFAIVVRVVVPQGPSYQSLEYPFAGYSSKVLATAGTSFVSSTGTQWTDTAATWRANVPMKVLVLAKPDCNDGNACTRDRWEGGRCTHVPAAAGTPCRAAAGACDVAETCTGSSSMCPVDAVRPMGTLCSTSPMRSCDGARKICGGS